MSNQLQSVLQGLTLQKPELPKKGEEEQQKPLFKKELPSAKLEVEFQRKVALECGKRCMMHRPPKPSEVQAN